MKLPLTALWDLRTRLDRGPFVIWGVGLTLLKYVLDRLLYAWLHEGAKWSTFAYWQPGALFGGLDRVRVADVLPFVLLAAPFIWVGVALCVRRLRSAALPTWLALLFFLPAVNVVLFALLATLPERPADASPSARGRDFLARLVPPSAVGSALVGAALSLPIGILATWFGASYLGSYGWGLFLGIPFVQGLLASSLHGVHARRSFSSCAGVALLAVAMTGFLLLLMTIEGAICIAMAAPIAAALALLGGAVGWSVQACGRARDASSTFMSLSLVAPLVVAWEAFAPPKPTRFAVRTAVEVDAPPERVWREVISFAELAPPTEWYFKAGIAYPIRAEIEGEGVGAVRHCVFSTGAFVEPIEVWDAPRVLEFSVTEQPPAMRELMLVDGVQPPHVDDYLVSERGRFLLEPLPGGRTRLEGTTWYTHRLWPERYWKLWSDALLHRIHRRVLEHVARRAEAGG